MEHSLEDLIAMYDESVTIAKNEKRRQKDILKKIVNNFCEHRVGQKATFEKDGRSHTIVCCNINPDIFHGSVIYTYDFKLLKKDGTLSQNHIYVYNQKINWIDEYMQV